MLQALRPRQWSKNGLLVRGPSLYRRPSPPAWPTTRAWSAVSSSSACFPGCAYLLNDIQDVHADRLHPRKRHRPIAAGRLPKSRARLFVYVAVPVAFAVGWFAVGWGFDAVALTYFVMTVAYSYRLKNVVVLDVMIVAAGFVLRAIAGAVAIGVDPSVWLLLCTGLLALFLAVGKRRGELVALGAAPPTRPILAEYTIPLLDQMITIVAATCIMAYSLYTFYSDTGRQRPYLMATIPFVLYGLFRYLYLVYRHDKGEAPESVLAEDLPLRINLGLWVIVALLALLTHQYLPPR